MRAPFAAAVLAAAALASTAQATQSPTVSLRHTSRGNVLVNSRGRTLYLFESDTRNHSNCTGQCASNWPPLLVGGSPHAGPGVSGGKLGSIRRGNSHQVTYNGHPLYTFSGDGGAGQTNGEGQFAFGNYWYVVTAAGSAG
jgi:predicted lipoprotein with Yx(FWY)xxD motif